MSLTRVSPALFQVSNNITSVTVGGSANTVSLTFDSNGVITGASNNALSVANTQITGLIEAAQIGSANATLVTSGTLPAARLPAGSVIQVVNATTSTSVSSSTSTFIDTTLTATITPSSASSKILVLVNQTAITKNNGTYGNLRLLRGAVVLYEVDKVWAYTGTAAQNYVGGTGTNYLDSPATTSATTYKTQFMSVANIAVVAVQDSGSTSTITLMEIAG